MLGVGFYGEEGSEKEEGIRIFKKEGRNFEGIKEYRIFRKRKGWYLVFRGYFC